MTTYYTNFCFEGYKPSEFHCTHMYFGEIVEERTLLDIKVIISCYFSINPLKKTQLLFDVRDLFGDEKSVPVLLTKDKDLYTYGNLRHRLIRYLKDTKSFRPHITTNLSEFYATMDRYSLVEKTDKGVEEILIINAK
jgi:hypothetical protein